MKFRHRNKVKNLDKIQEPRNFNEVGSDKELVYEIIQEIGQIVNSKRYLTEIVENETVKLLDSLSVRELDIAKKVLDELKVKYPDLVKHYRLKENTETA